MLLLLLLLLGAATGDNDVSVLSLVEMVVVCAEGEDGACEAADEVARVRETGLSEPGLDVGPGDKAGNVNRQHASGVTQSRCQVTTSEDSRPTCKNGR